MVAYSVLSSNKSRHYFLFPQYHDDIDKVAPDPTVTWEVYDRVVTVREGAVIPVGLRGTVIGVTKSKLRSNDSMMVLYDATFSVGDHVTRSLETPAYALLNLSHGTRHAEQLRRQGNHLSLHAHPVPMQSRGGGRL